MRPEWIESDVAASVADLAISLAALHGTTDPAQHIEEAIDLIRKAGQVLGIEEQ
jgi:hypothetical protein